MPAKLTRQGFIDKANEIFGDYYDYSRVVYVGSIIPVEVICQYHGSFFTTPNRHTSGSKSGCPQCGYIKMKKKQPEPFSFFLGKATAKHGNKFTYAESEYVNMKTEITITCPLHGSYKQTPNLHVRSEGCKKCGYIKSGRSTAMTFAKFLDKARSVHGNTYDYKEDTFIGAGHPLTIICKTHGPFQQIAGVHIDNHGCPTCAIWQRAEGNTKGTEWFIAKATAVHHGRYSYKNSVYAGCETPVVITCPKHGDFTQVAIYHLSGNGCDKCSLSTGEISIAKFLDSHGIEYVRQKRYSECRNINPLPFDFYIPSHNALIEYHGEQHYKTTEYFGGSTAFIKRMYNDWIKEQWATRNGFNLIVIPFFLENILAPLDSLVNNPACQPWPMI